MLQPLNREIHIKSGTETLPMYHDHPAVWAASEEVGRTEPCANRGLIDYLE